MAPIIGTQHDTHDTKFRFVHGGITAVRQVAPVLSLAALLTLAVHVPAQAVPGSAYTTRELSAFGISTCAAHVKQAIQKLLNSNATVYPLNTSNAYMIDGFSQYTGIFVYCIPDTAKKVCNEPATIISMVLFSDSGSNEAVKVRDDLNAAIGNPHIIDCGSINIPVDE